MATGKYCNNYNAEAAALVHAAKALREHLADAREKVVIFTGTLSEMKVKVVIQWVPAHCEIQGNEEVDKLAKKGGALQQGNTGSNYEVAKSVIKNIPSSKWEKEHPAHIKGDAYHQLPRHAQVTILRLRTGHNRLKYHMYHKYKIGETDLCTCGTTPMTAEHLLQECSSYSKEKMGKYGSSQSPSVNNCTETL